MKRKTINPLWLVLATAALLFVLSACERPVPQPEVPTTTAPEVVPTTAPELIVPTLMPPEPTIAPYPGPGETPGETPVEATAVPEGGETIPQATPVVDPTGPQSHTVQAGETLFSISQKYNVPAAEIAAANNLANVNQLDVGQVLVIPVAGSTPPTGTTPPTTGEQVHVVQPGENLFRIALGYGLTTNELAAYNGIADPTLIFVGQVIRIPPR